LKKAKLVLLSGVGDRSLAQAERSELASDYRHREDRKPENLHKVEHEPTDWVGVLIGQVVAKPQSTGTGPVG